MPSCIARRHGKLCRCVGRPFQSGARRTDASAHKSLRCCMQGAVTTITSPKPTTDMVACFAIFYGAQP